MFPHALQASPAAPRDGESLANAYGRFDPERREYAIV